MIARLPNLLGNRTCSIHPLQPIALGKYAAYLQSRRL